MSKLIEIMGLVQEGRFKPSVPSGRLEPYARLTYCVAETGAAPESQEVDLSLYDGRAIMVRGLDSGNWIYSAEVIEVAGPILSAVVERLSGL
jgi:hypothetical protein